MTAESELRVWAGEPIAAVSAPTRQHNPLPREGVELRRHVAFAAGTAALVSASADGVVVRDVSVAGMQGRACMLAGRDMRAEDWRRYLQDEPPPPPACAEILRPDGDLARRTD